MPLKIIRNDIVKVDAEAIVNTASREPIVGTGVDKAIYVAAGYNELLSYRKKNVGLVEEGNAFVTPGFKLKAKYIIHAVSPLYKDGDSGEEKKLRQCYKVSLFLAKKYGVKSIAFPLIATGSFGYPKEEGMRIAIDEINAFLLTNQLQIYLVVFDTKATLLGESIYPDLEAYIDHYYVQEKREEEYGDRFFGSVRQDDSDYSEYARRREDLEKRLQKNEPQTQAEACIRPMPSQSPNCQDLGDVSDCNASIEDFDDNKDIFGEKISLADEAGIRRIETLLSERMKHMSDTFSEYLLYLIENKGFTNVEVYKKAVVDKKIFSKIKNDKKYHPQKITALCLCIGAELNMDETKDLLARAGYALSPCDMTDIIFSFFIENKIYDMIELDIQLEEHGLSCIIA